MLERLLYISRAQPSVEARDVYDIIRAAHQLAQRLGQWNTRRRRD